MSSVTLSEASKLVQDKLISGLIETVITANMFFEVMPFSAISGNALAYNRENALGDVITGTVGTTFSGAGAGKAPATFTTVTANLTTIMGDAEVNGLIQATRSVNGVDQVAIQIASKAKSCGRKYQNMLINGTGAGNDFTGLLGLVASSNIITQDTNGVTTNGGPLSFAKMDEAMDAVLDKDGQVDYCTMHSRTIRSFKVLLRALGGASVNEVLELPSGNKVPVYEGVPVFRNDWIPTAQTMGNSTKCASAIFGTLDDGSLTKGISGLTAQDNAGIHVVPVGEKEDADESIWRVRWYCGLANPSALGLVVLNGITN